MYMEHVVVVDGPASVSASAAEAGSRKLGVQCGTLQALEPHAGTRTCMGSQGRVGAYQV